MKKGLIISGLVAGLALATATYAEQGHHGDGPGQGGPGQGGPGGGPHGGGMEALLENPEMVKKLGITADQVKAIEEANYEHQKVMVSLRADTELAQLDVKKLLDKDAPETEAVMKAMDTSGKLETEIRKEAVRHQLKIREIVGPETAKKIRDMMQANRQQRMEEGRGKGGQGRGKNGGPRGGDEGAPPGDR